MLKDAPLPVKLVANVMTSLVGGAMREIAADSDDLLDQATRQLQMDDRLPGFSLGPVFSTSSSSSSINGVGQKQVALQCQIVGGDGMTQGSALVEGRMEDRSAKFGLVTFRVQLRDGRQIDVLARSNTGGTNRRSGDTIDVEIVAD